MRLPAGKGEGFLVDKGLRFIYGYGVEYGTVRSRDSDEFCSSLFNIYEYKEPFTRPPASFTSE